MADRYQPDGGQGAEFDSSNLVTAMIVAGTVAVALIGLVILRFSCNLAIDVVILGDMRSARRSIRKVLKWLVLPFRQDQEPSEAGHNSTSTNIGTQEAIASFQKRPLQTRLAVITSLLQTKELTAEDLDRWKDYGGAAAAAAESPPLPCDGGESGKGCEDGNKNLVCPICLHEFVVEESIVKTSCCSQVFHHECIAQWLSSHGTDCPYCRSNIITTEDLIRACATLDH